METFNTSCCVKVFLTLLHETFRMFSHIWMIRIITELADTLMLHFGVQQRRRRRKSRAVKVHTQRERRRLRRADDDDDDASLTRREGSRERWREEDTEQERERLRQHWISARLSLPPSLPLSGLLPVVVVVVVAAALINSSNDVVHQLRLGQNARDPAQQAAVLVRNKPTRTHGRAHSGGPSACFPPAVPHCRAADARGC